MPEKNQYKSFKQIVNTFYNEELEEIDSNNENAVIRKKKSIKLQPKIYYDKFTGDMRAEFKIGNSKMYKIKELSEFYNAIMERKFLKYGEKLQFIHTREVFEENSIAILDFILKYAEIIKYANSNSNSNYRYYGKALSDSYIMLGNSGIDELFEILKEKMVTFQRDYTKEEIKFTDEQPKIEFKLKKIENNQYAIVPNIDIFNVTIIKGKNYKYVLDKEKMYRCTKEFENTNLKLLEIFRKNYLTEVLLSENELSQLFSIVVPKVKDAIIIEGMKKEEVSKYKPKDLQVKLYLDFDEKDFLIADVKFCYEKDEFNPLDEKIKPKFPRNILEETKSLKIFRETGFMFDANNLRFILPKNDDIYKFLTEDINYYMQKFEVLISEKFKTKQIRQPKIGELGIKIDNNLLEVDLKNLDINYEELKDVMEKYSLKKKYYRLKDGTFINFENSKEIEFLDKLINGMNISYEDIEKNEIKIPIYRSLYLNQILKGIKGTEIIKDKSFKEVVNRCDKEQIEEIVEIPEELNKILRYYQKNGVKWLKALDEYKFGGILADDMGLRKNNPNFSINIRL